jgi:hypothetical protein
MLRALPFSSTAEIRIAPAPLAFSPEVEAAVEGIWQAEQARRGKALFDGKILSATAIEQDRILAGVARYRHLIAQRIRPDLFGAHRLRPLAVSGLLECADGIVFGRRAPSVTQHPGCWELAPSGGIDADETHGQADFRRQILQEMEEELGLSEVVVANVRPFALVDDSDSHVIDIGVVLACGLSGAAIQSAHRERGTREYEQLRIVPFSEVAQFLSSQADRMVQVSVELLRLYRRSGR